MKLLDDRPTEIIIVAMTRERVIGAGGRMPWHCPEELQLFRSLTVGGTMVMGRRTFVSIGRPLPDRRNLVVSTTLAPQPGIIVCRSFAEAVAVATEAPPPIFYLGGVDIYRQALARVDALYVSWFKGSYPGDVRFPEIDLNAWEITFEEPHAAFVHTRYRRRPVYR